MLAIAFVATLGKSGNWYCCLAAPALPALLLVPALLHLPESPRWLLVTGQQSAAQRSLDTVFASAPLLGYAWVGRAPRVVLATRGAASQHESQDTAAELQALLAPDFRQTTLACCLLAICIQGASDTSWIFGPTLLTTGEPEATSSSFFDVFAGTEVTGALGSLVAMLTLDRVGRIPVLASAGLASFAAFMSLASLQPSSSMAARASLWQLHGLCDGMLWCTMVLYLGEVVPTKLRASGIGLASGCGRLAAMVLPLALGPLLNGRPQVALCIVAGLYLAGGGTACVALRETAGCSLCEGGGQASAGSVEAL